MGASLCRKRATRALLKKFLPSHPQIPNPDDPPAAPDDPPAAPDDPQPSSPRKKAKKAAPVAGSKIQVRQPNLWGEWQAPVTRTLTTPSPHVSSQDPSELKRCLQRARELGARVQELKKVHAENEEKLQAAEAKDHPPDSG